MAASEAEFLKAGVHRYAEACDTIRAFQEALAGRLMAVLNAKTSFGDFQRDVRLPKPQDKDHTHWGRWIAATATGTVNRRALEVEIGVWWYGREGLPPVMFYVSSTDGMFQKRPVPSLPPPIRAYDDSKRIYLYVEPGEEFDFDHEFDLLIRTFVSSCVKTA
ncbi:hypothetical protein [Hyalangium gracile]|uniref:hypothetical protein n=1 Tax=Hyalangium gracile TaxID=394092 RepID=UPI001CCEC2E5|nr:hypothetical protein [Hyalangium gracile]